MLVKVKEIYMRRIILFACVGMFMTACTSLQSHKSIELPQAKKINLETSKVKEKKAVFIPEIDIINPNLNFGVSNKPKNKDIKIDDKTIVDINKKIVKNHLAYVEKSEQPFTGTFVLKIGNHLQYTEQYNKGKLNGQKIWYSESGEIGMIEEYKDGVLDGNKSSYYRENGKIKSVIPYVAGELSGKMISYTSTGKIISQELFVDGSGEWKTYWDNELLKEEGTMKSGRKDGIWKNYNREGKLEKVTNYKFGKIVKREWL